MWSLSGQEILENSPMNILYALLALKNDFTCVLSVRKTLVLTASTFLETEAKQPGMSI